MSKFPFQPEKHSTDPVIMKLLYKYPIQTKYDKVYGNQWRFRTTSENDLKTDEAVVIIPGTYETCTSYIYLLDRLVSLGYRAVIIDFGEYPKFKQIAKAFDQFCDGIGVNKAHIIGDDLGGFIALQVASHPKIGTKILSISLINSFTSLSVLKKPNFLFSVFGQLSARSILQKEIDNFHIPQEYTSAVFIKKEIENELPEVLAARIKMREAKTMQIQPRCDPASIMSIETLDKFFVFDEKFLPSIGLKGCRQALMKFGGEWPHIQNPDDIVEYITAHLRKWGKLPKNLEEAQKEANKEQEEAQINDDKSNEKEEKQNEIESKESNQLNDNNEVKLQESNEKEENIQNEKEKSTQEDDKQNDNKDNELNQDNNESIITQNDEKQINVDSDNKENEIEMKNEEEHENSQPKHELEIDSQETEQKENVERNVEVCEHEN